MTMHRIRVSAFFALLAVAVLLAVPPTASAGASNYGGRYRRVVHTFQWPAGAHNWTTDASVVRLGLRFRVGREAFLRGLRVPVALAPGAGAATAPSTCNFTAALWFDADGATPVTRVARVPVTLVVPPLALGRPPASTTAHVDALRVPWHMNTRLLTTGMYTLTWNPFGCGAGVTEFALASMADRVTWAPTETTDPLLTPVSAVHSVSVDDASETAPADLGAFQTPLAPDEHYGLELEVVRALPPIANGTWTDGGGTFMPHRDYVRTSASLPLPPPVSPGAAYCGGEAARPTCIVNMTYPLAAPNASCTPAVNCTEPVGTVLVSVPAGDSLHWLGYTLDCACRPYGWFNETVAGPPLWRETDAVALSLLASHLGVCAADSAGDAEGAIFYPTVASTVTYDAFVLYPALGDFSIAGVAVAALDDASTTPAEVDAEAHMTCDLRTDTYVLGAAAPGDGGFVQAAASCYEGDSYQSHSGVITQLLTNYPVTTTTALAVVGGELYLTAMLQLQNTLAIPSTATLGISNIPLCLISNFGSVSIPISAAGTYFFPDIIVTPDEPTPLECNVTVLVSLTVTTLGLPTYQHQNDAGQTCAPQLICCAYAESCTVGEDAKTHSVAAGALSGPLLRNDGGTSQVTSTVVLTTTSSAPGVASVVGNLTLGASIPPGTVVDLTILLYARGTECSANTGMEFATISHLGVDPETFTNFSAIAVGAQCGHTLYYRLAMQHSDGSDTANFIGITDAVTLDECLPLHVCCVAPPPPPTVGTNCSTGMTVVDLLLFQLLGLDLLGVNASLVIGENGTLSLGLTTALLAPLSDIIRLEVEICNAACGEPCALPMETLIVNLTNINTTTVLNLGLPALMCNTSVSLRVHAFLDLPLLPDIELTLGTGALCTNIDICCPTGPPCDLSDSFRDFNLTAGSGTGNNLQLTGPSLVDLNATFGLVTDGNGGVFTSLDLSIVHPPTFVTFFAIGIYPAAQCPGPQSGAIANLTVFTGSNGTQLTPSANLTAYCGQPLEYLLVAISGDGVTTIFAAPDLTGTTCLPLNICCPAVVPPSPSAPNATGLLTCDAEQFAVLGGSGGVTYGSTLPIVIIGDIGSFPGASAVPINVVLIGTNHGTGIESAAAQADVEPMLTAAETQPCAIIATELGGTTRTTGAYCAASGTFGITGILTLDGLGDPNAVFLFVTESTLITAGSSSFILVNGARACNVYWAVGSSATLGATSSFVGTLTARISITLSAGTSVSGRLLAGTAITVADGTAVTVPSCSSLDCDIVTPVPTPTPPPIVGTNCSLGVTPISNLVFDLAGIPLLGVNASLGIDGGGLSLGLNTVLLAPLAGIVHLEIDVCNASCSDACLVPLETLSIGLDNLNGTTVLNLNLTDLLCNTSISLRIRAVITLPIIGDVDLTLATGALCTDIDICCPAGPPPPPLVSTNCTTGTTPLAALVFNSGPLPLLGANASLVIGGGNALTLGLDTALLAPLALTDLIRLQVDVCNASCGDACLVPLETLSVNLTNLNGTTVLNLDLSSLLCNSSVSLRIRAFLIVPLVGEVELTLATGALCTEIDICCPALATPSPSSPTPSPPSPTPATPTPTLPCDLSASFLNFNVTPGTTNSSETNNFILGSSPFPPIDVGINVTFGLVEGPGGSVLTSTGISVIFPPSVTDTISMSIVVYSGDQCNGTALTFLNTPELITENSTTTLAPANLTAACNLTLSFTLAVSLSDNALFGSLDGVSMCMPLAICCPPVPVPTPSPSSPTPSPPTPSPSPPDTCELGVTFRDFNISFDAQNASDANNLMLFAGTLPLSYSANITVGLAQSGNSLLMSTVFAVVFAPGSGPTATVQMSRRLYTTSICSFGTQIGPPTNLLATDDGTLVAPLTNVTAFCNQSLFYNILLTTAPVSSFVFSWVNSTTCVPVNNPLGGVCCPSVPTPSPSSPSPSPPTPSSPTPSSPTPSSPTPSPPTPTPSSPTPSSPTPSPPTPSPPTPTPSSPTPSETCDSNTTVLFEIDQGATAGTNMLSPGPSPASIDISMAVVVGPGDTLFATGTITVVTSNPGLNSLIILGVSCPDAFTNSTVIIGSGTVPLPFINATACCGSAVRYTVLIPYIFSGTTVSGLSPEISPCCPAPPPSPTPSSPTPTVVPTPTEPPCIDPAVVHNLNFTAGAATGNNNVLVIFGVPLTSANITIGFTVEANGGVTNNVQYSLVQSSPSSSISIAISVYNNEDCLDPSIVTRDIDADSDVSASLPPLSLAVACNQTFYYRVRIDNQNDTNTALILGFAESSTCTPVELCCPPPTCVNGSSFLDFNMTAGSDTTNNLQLSGELPDTTPIASANVTFGFVVQPNGSVASSGVYSVSAPALVFASVDIFIYGNGDCLGATVAELHSGPIVIFANASFPAANLSALACGEVFSYRINITSTNGITADDYAAVGFVGGRTCLLQFLCCPVTPPPTPCTNGSSARDFNMTAGSLDANNFNFAGNVPPSASANLTVVLAVAPNGSVTVGGQFAIDHVTSNAASLDIYVYDNADCGAVPVANVHFFSESNQDVPLPAAVVNGSMPTCGQAFSYRVQLFTTNGTPSTANSFVNGQQCIIVAPFCCPFPCEAGEVVESLAFSNGSEEVSVALLLSTQVGATTLSLTATPSSPGTTTRLVVQLCSVLCNETCANGTGLLATLNTTSNIMADLAPYCNATLSVRVRAFVSVNGSSETELDADGPSCVAFDVCCLGAPTPTPVPTPPDNGGDDGFCIPRPALCPGVDAATALGARRRRAA